MANAQAEVRAIYPSARAARGMFGMVVVDEATGAKIGDGRCYYEEEAWIEAAGLVYEQNTREMAKNHGA